MECVNTITGKSVSGALCKARNQPKRIEACIAPMCVTWHADEWKQCSTECGNVRKIHILYNISVYSPSV